MEAYTVDNGNFTSISPTLDVDTFLSDEILQQFKFAMYVVLVEIISFFGVIFNIINIVIFVKMGFKDPVNISLLSLAIADTGALLPLLWMGLCYNPLLANQFPNINFQGIQHLTAGMPHVCFSRITSWLTALVTFERYLCVAFPLKVKNLVTRGRTVVGVISIFIFMISGEIPLYLGSTVGPQYLPETNRTVFSLIYLQNGHELESGTTNFNAIVQILAFVLVVISTVGLVQRIQSKSKWRQSTSTALKNENTSLRDKNVVKMIICIATIFTVTYFPVIVCTIFMICFEDFRIQGRHASIFLVSWMFFFFLEAINSSVNMFVYLNMSSKFRTIFIDIFGRSKKL